MVVIERFNIYLAGGMGKFGKGKFEEGNEWRKYCKKALEDYECDLHKVVITNPNNYFNFKDDPPKYQSEREVMEFDLHKVRNSNLIIINFNDMWSLGSMAELAIAYEKRIPVVGLNESGQELHPWQVEMTNRIFNNIDDMLDYVEDFYLR